MNLVKVWCEYDFNGRFGGNNNEDVFVVPSDTNEKQDEAAIEQKLVNATGVSAADLDGLWNWEYIEVIKV